MEVPAKGTGMWAENVMRLQACDPLVKMNPLVLKGKPFDVKVIKEHEMRAARAWDLRISLSKPRIS